MSTLEDLDDMERERKEDDKKKEGSGDGDGGSDGDGNEKDGKKDDGDTAMTDADQNDDEKEKKKKEAEAEAEAERKRKEEEEEEANVLDDEILNSSTRDIIARRRLLENDTRIMKSEFQRLTHEKLTMHEKIKDNQEKIENNRQLPYLVGNVVEILDLDVTAEAAEEGANIDLDATRVGKSAVIKTSTRQTIFLPLIGLVDYEKLKPGDLIGVNKDSYLVLDTLPAEYDSRVKAMEVDEKPTEKYTDVGGLDKQIEELVEAVVWPMKEAERFKKIGIKAPKGMTYFFYCFFSKIAALHYSDFAIFICFRSICLHSTNVYSSILQELSCTAHPEPAKPSSLVPAPPKQTLPSSSSPVPNSYRCSSATVPSSYATVLHSQKKKLPPSSSSTSSTPSARNDSIPTSPAIEKSNEQCSNCSTNSTDSRQTTASRSSPPRTASTCLTRLFSGPVGSTGRLSSSCRTRRRAPRF